MPLIFVLSSGADPMAQLVRLAEKMRMEERKVAVKKVTKTGCQKVTEGFYREIQIMKDLDHPNICKLLGTFEQGRDMYFIMELCEGGELFDRIIDSGKIDQRFSADIIKQVSSALAYAHGRSIAHRDIKPENVVFCTKDSSQVKLIDWGLAMSFMGSSMTSAVGSFTYAAPEVIQSNNITAYTAKCDLWSLGVLTYVMLSGKPPFWGNHQQFVAKQKKEQYPLKGDPWDKMPQSAKDFVKKLLKANPDERLAIDKVVVHEWLATIAPSGADDIVAKDVLQNLRHYSGATTFERLCITAVARQLDHKNLTEVHHVFRDMDSNGDGVLSLKEVQSGFARIFGNSSPEVKQLQDVFEKMDLDGSNTIDYTEFCAAGLGQRTSSQDSVLWAAFKAFDKSNTGFIEKEDLKALLDNADVQDTWTEDVCHEAATEIIAQFDKDGDARICFEDWKTLMEKCWSRHAPKSAAEGGAGGGGDAVTANPYALLEQVSKLPAGAE
jgi:calcium-dependent protein kinase